MNEKLTQFLIDLELLDSEGEAMASISHNQNISWSKLLFTDDVPNANKQRIPKEEFPNILRTGVLMPIKMATGRINDGHEDAVPLGVISHLKDEGNKVLGLAALWATERADDVKILKEMSATENKPQLSWEVYYGSSSKDENGIEDLHDVTVKAITVVGAPAYRGRTSILAMAGKQSETSANEEENKVTEDEVKLKIEELEKKIEALLADITSKDGTIETQNVELSSLREYKSSIENEKLETQKFASIKKQFKDAGIEKEDVYFDTNKEPLMKLGEAELAFMLQEMVAFANSSKTNESNSSVPVPPFSASNSSEPRDPKSLAKALKELSIKK